MERAKDMLAAGQKLRILLIERDDAGAMIVAQALTDAGFVYELERARDDRELRSRLAARFDVVIADRHFTARDRMRATEIMRDAGVDVPLVFISERPEGKRNCSLASLTSYRCFTT